MALRIRATHWLLAGGLMLAASPAFAQEGMLFKNLVDGVWGKRGDADIEYRQRAPLVVPPGSALPRPQDPGTARSAAWPNDPDVARRRADRDQALVPATERERYKEQQRPLLSQDELRKGRIAGSSPSRLDPEYGSKTYEENIGPIRAGRDMAARQNVDDLAKLQYGSEPDRKYLYQPPVGYRMPSGTAPVGPGRGAPIENTQATGQKEFVQGTGMPTLPSPN